MNALRKHRGLLAAALLLLPVMVVAAAWGYAALGALPQVRFTGDQIEALAWLPVLTAYAGGVIVVAAFFNVVFTWEPGRETEEGWHRLALDGDANARWLLVRHDIRWLALLVMTGAFFWVAR